MPHATRSSFSPLAGRRCRQADEGHRGVFARLALVLFLLLSPLPAFAVNPDEVLPDPALEARARALSAQLRCMVCQNQSIDDSNAELARDLRVLVRERIVSGDSDEAVIDYVVSRYGEFVLLKPRLRGETLLLWGAPIVLFLGGAVAMTLFVRRRAGKAVGEPLTVEEKAALDRIVGEGHAKSVGSEK
ncbi:cytochrome c-type biogenesis protein CcmH [Rhizobium azooxidifex]|uniref:Cytochrome c-type biogenesis protein n=1 Tax=Mycoplana azooxidifex TaxID=1636188 RepID=A0A7W6D9T1_9HYPH|nr:cytochrome c-type biogenesis protein CcmH [Mycoplana azooxidifex]